MTACPTCGCLGRFPRHRRHVGGHNIEVYISCTKCPYEQVLRSGPKQLVELEEDVDRLRARVRAGQGHFRDLLARRERRLEALRRELAS